MGGASHETSRSAWSPTSTGAMMRYERWGGRIEKQNLSVGRRTRAHAHHSEGSDATVCVVSWVGASTPGSRRRARAVTASARRSEGTIVGAQTMRCAERHSCDRFRHFPYENRDLPAYKHEPANWPTIICDVVGMSPFRISATTNANGHFAPSRRPTDVMAPA